MPTGIREVDPREEAIEFNTLSETFDFNVLVNYRINAGTVFFLGYDDHYRQADLIRGDSDGDGIDDQLFLSDVFDYIERFHNPRIQRRLDSLDRELSTLTQPSVKTG